MNPKNSKSNKLNHQLIRGKMAGSSKMKGSIHPKQSCVCQFGVLRGHIAFSWEPLADGYCNILFFLVCEHSSFSNVKSGLSLSLSLSLCNWIVVSAKMRLSLLLMQKLGCNNYTLTLHVKLRTVLTISKLLVQSII